MLQVLLLILKIILWVILGLLGLILLLALLVLFAPIKYTVDAQYYGKAKVKAKISFLIVSVRVFFDQESGEMNNLIRILGIPFKPKGKTDKEASKKDSSHKGKKENNDKVEDTKTLDEDVSSQTKIDEHTEYTSSQTVDSTASLNETYDLWDNEEDILSDEEKNFWGRVKIFFRKIFDKLVKFKDFIFKLNPDNIEEAYYSKTAKIRKIVNRFKQFWDMKCTIKTRAYLKKYIIGLFKHIAPRKVKGYIHFGMDEPYKTGTTIGYLSMIPFSYQKHLQWEPDFYNKVMEGELYLKGKLRIGYIARIVLNINIWKTIKMAKK